MILDCDIEKLDEVLHDFARATGVPVSLMNEDFSYYHNRKNPENNFCRCMEECSECACICQASNLKLLERCRKSLHTEMHICHAGLVDIVSPILYEGRILGYIIMGQMKQEPDFSVIAPYLATLPLDLAEMERYYKDLVFFDEERILGVVNLAVLLARYLILENIITPSVDRNMAAALEYIEQNLSEPLNIQCISSHANLSASTLYRTFRTRFHCTVSEYITDKRIIRSEALLRGTALSVEEIAQQAGFSSAAYYSRCFRKKNGVSPLQYRKLHRSAVKN